MGFVHQELASGRWATLPLIEQLGNVGSEVERALDWAARGKVERSDRALERALELIQFTIADPKHKRRLRELTRTREVLLDYFWGNNEYSSTEDELRRYFRAFAMAVAIQKEREGKSRLRQQ